MTSGTEGVGHSGNEPTTRRDGYPGEYILIVLSGGRVPSGVDWSSGVSWVPTVSPPLKTRNRVVELRNGTEGREQDFLGLDRGDSKETGE